MPNIYKASNVTLAGDAVQIDAGGAAYGAYNGLAASGADTADSPPGNTQGIEIEVDLTKVARAQAKAILERARNEAAAISEDAERETERLRAEALERARGQGYDEGFAKGLGDGEAMKREAERIFDEIYKEREAIVRGMEPKMVGLIIKILDKLIGEAARVNPQIIQKLIREGLSAVVGSEGAKLRVSPEDYDTVRGHWGAVTEYAGSNAVELVKDASLNRMDCVIETQYGNIDSSLEQQFEALKADLLYTLGGGRDV